MTWPTEGRGAILPPNVHFEAREGGQVGWNDENDLARKSGRPAGLGVNELLRFRHDVVDKVHFGPHIKVERGGIFRSRCRRRRRGGRLLGGRHFHLRRRFRGFDLVVIFLSSDRKRTVEMEDFDRFFRFRPEVSDFRCGRLREPPPV